jgi:O-6-methylguanine DNA methyltransferase
MVSDFAEKVYQILRSVPQGRVTTYKNIAQKLGTKAYQAVGTALANNPYAPQVPCHRVVASDGKIGGFMGKKTGETIDKKIVMLEKEGVIVKDGKVVNFEKIRY